MKPKILTTLPAYTVDLFRADALAGVTVAMVAIPLSLAIAIASGAEPAAGLVTAIVAGFLISALGSSRVQIGGPTGAFIVVVAGVVSAHGYDGLVLATLLAGGVLVAAVWLDLRALLALPLSLALLIGLGRWMAGRLGGGLTGDCYGALCEVTEFMCLLGMVLWQG